MIRGAGAAAAASMHAQHNNNEWELNAAMSMLDDHEGDDLLNFVTFLPEQKLWVHSELAKKRTADDTFVQRRIIITDRSLFFAHEDTSNDRVLDQVQLHEVAKVSIPEAKPAVVGHLSSESHALGGRAPNDDGCSFIVSTISDGRNAGRSYQLKCDSIAQAENLVNILNGLVAAAQIRESSGKTFASAQAWVDQKYSSDVCQVFIAFMIFLSFLGNVAELEIDPAQENPTSKQFFYNADLFFTIIFSLELMVNMFANWFKPFWRDYWNIFDFFIVTSSVVALVIDRATASSDDGNSGAMNAVRTIRLLRAFRVMRLFGRLESIRKIISALGQSLIPVGNAFVIVLLIMAVYAIIGVTIFRESQPDAFSTWSRGLYTMFTVTTMDGWQELVVIPMLTEEDGSATVPANLGTVFFFVSFVVVVVWTMLPVVVAILLENFTEATHQEEHNAERRKMQRSGLDKMQHTLDPIFDLLSHYSTDLDLSQKIENLFVHMKGDEEVDTINFQNMSSGLRKKKWFHQIHLSQEDYESFTCNGPPHGYGDSEGNLTLADFEGAMRTQLKRYVQRQVAKQQFRCHVNGQEQISAMLLSMKLLHMDILSTSKSLRDPEDPTRQKFLSISKSSTPKSPYNTFQKAGHLVAETSQSRKPPALDTEYLHTMQENGAEQWQQRMERIMTGLCESVSDLQRELAKNNQKVEAPSRQVDEVGQNLHPTGFTPEAEGGRPSTTSALPSKPKAHMNGQESKSKGQYVSSDVVFESSTPGPSHLAMHPHVVYGEDSNRRPDYSVFF